MKFCLWGYDGDTDSWDTSCDEEFCFTDGGPEENGVVFCHHCGMRVVIKVMLPELDSDDQFYE